MIPAVDLVTETDQAVEKVISASLREKYPSFEFMGEVCALSLHRTPLISTFELVPPIGILGA